MAINPNSARERAGWPYLPWGSAVLFALLAACALPTSAMAAPADAPATEWLQTAEAVDPAATPSDPAQAAATSEETPNDEPPPAENDDEGKSGDTDAGQETGDMREQAADLSTEAQREALAEMIRRAVIETQKAAAEEAKKKAAERKATTQPGAAAPGSKASRIARRADARTTQPSVATTRPSPPALAKEDRGCGGASGPKVDLTPPPPDSPQPKFVCKQTKLTSEPIWQGKKAEFVFEIANEGEGPLAIRLRGG